jgi:hypothetical protein
LSDQVLGAFSSRIAVIDSSLILSVLMTLPESRFYGPLLKCDYSPLGHEPDRKPGACITAAASLALANTTRRHERAGSVGGITTRVNEGKGLGQAPSLK